MLGRILARDARGAQVPCFEVSRLAVRALSSGGAGGSGRPAEPRPAGAPLRPAKGAASRPVAPLSSAVVVARPTRPSVAAFVRSTHSEAADDGVPVGPIEEDDSPPAFEVTFDFAALAGRLEEARANCRARGSDADPDRVLALRAEHLAVLRELDEARARRNAEAKAEGARRAAAARAGGGVRAGNGAGGGEAAAPGALSPLPAASLKDLVSGLEAREREARSLLQSAAQALPNWTHAESPRSSREEDARLVKMVGEPRTSEGAGFPLKDHVALAESLGLADWRSGARVSGSRFVYLTGQAAVLEHALVSMALDRASRAGFLPVSPPDVVRAEVLERCGFRPRGESSQIYGLAGLPLVLTGTAEVPLAGTFLDRTLAEAELPCRLVGIGHAFRTEAGAPGAGTRGLYRLHQFTKAELFVACTPRDSDAQLDELVAFEVGMYEDLGLSFRVLDMPTGDLGAPAYRKFDIEAWMPGMERWGELSSASNCTDYQARRLGAKYRPTARAEGTPGVAVGKARPPKAEHVHTLNATAAAVPRLLIALLETHQREDGGVDIPEPLRPYAFGMAEIPPPQPRAGGA